MELDSAYSLISKAVREGRAAHGYLVVGGVRGLARELATLLLKELFPGTTDESLKTHPDIHWLYPEMKSRIISVESVHSKLIDPMTQTSFSGGWKVGVMMGADRLNTAGANAFLKMLEEPPKNTLFLLLTDSPEQLLPTIVSRCQRIDLPDAREHLLSDPWRTNVFGILADPDLEAVNVSGLLKKASAAERLAAVLESLKEKAEEEVGAEIRASEQEGAELSEKEETALVSSRYREYRRDFLFTVMEFFARRMRAEPGCQAFRNIEAVEDLALSFERNMNEEAVLSYFMDRVRFDRGAK
jgi:DNA polymerase-3 subunit delta'